MLKRLTRHGNSLALVIDRAVLELLNIEADTPLDISTDGESLMITPIHDAERKRQFEAALESTNRRYGKVLKRLAS